MFYYYPNSRGIGAGNASHIDIYLGNGHSIGASGSSVHVGPVDWSAWLGGAAVPGLFR
jgi:cell wall-associated NlpC family hydrolase